MAEVIWLRAALDDLDAIAAYIGQDSPRYAADFVQRIIDAAELLAGFPRMGPRIPEWDDDDYRQRIVGNYRLIYRLRGDQVQVLTVHHGARLLPSAIKRRQAGARRPPEPPAAR